MYRGRLSSVVAEQQERQIDVRKIRAQADLGVRIKGLQLPNGAAMTVIPSYF